ncbi:MAG: hypothetical protein ACI84C_002956 [Flavobacteriales bacterium]|jgi:hypothetical protein
MQRSLFFISAILALSFSSIKTIAQSEDPEGPTIIYNQQMLGGLHLHSNGYGLQFAWGRYKGASKIWTYSADLLYMKHDKEVRSYNPAYQDSKSYVYGKMNSLFVLRAGIGRKHITSVKLRKSGVQVSYLYSFGPLLGFAKPVYLEISNLDEGSGSLSTERYDPELHFFDDIYGRAPFVYGLTEISVIPGGFAKFAFNFEYSNTKNRLKGLETGVVLDAYLRRVPIMAESIGGLEGAKNKRLFFNFYVNLFLGKKYNKR